MYDDDAHRLNRLKRNKFTKTSITRASNAADPTIGITERNARYQ